MLMLVLAYNQSRAVLLKLFALQPPFEQKFLCNPINKYLLSLPSSSGTGMLLFLSEMVAQIIKLYAVLSFILTDILE